MVPLCPSKCPSQPPNRPPQKPSPIPEPPNPLPQPPKHPPYPPNPLLVAETHLLPYPTLPVQNVESWTSVSMLTGCTNVACSATHLSSLHIAIHLTVYKEPGIRLVHPWRRCSNKGRIRGATFSFCPQPSHCNGLVSEADFGAECHKFSNIRSWWRWSA
jgi:hypothetical protein